MTKTLPARRRVVAVLCGGFLGTLARYCLSMLAQGWLGKGWPYDILLINLTGALLLALVSTLADATILVGPTRRLLINTGFLGAYTTFSSLALGDVLLFSKGAFIPALLYLVLSLSGGLGMVLLGDWLGQKLVAGLRKRSHLPQAVLEPSLPAGHLDIEDDILLPDQIREFGQWVERL
jgi:fluoride exporter